jgi:hypothetical protein
MLAKNLVTIRTASRLLGLAAAASLCCAVPARATYTLTIMEPSGFSASIGNGLSTSIQVGQANGHAIAWHGSPTNYTDLNGTLFNSMANATSVSDKAGWSLTTSTSPEHATLWSGTSNTFYDLHPTSGVYQYTVVNGMSGGFEVGGGEGPGETGHAVVWTGASNIPEDLTPAKVGTKSPAAMLYAACAGSSGSTRVCGFQTPDNATVPAHATYWENATGSWIQNDLTPSLANSSSSLAYGCSGDVCVGIYSDSVNTDGIIWEDTHHDNYTGSLGPNTWATSVFGNYAAATIGGWSRAVVSGVTYETPMVWTATWSTTTLAWTITSATALPQGSYINGEALGVTIVSGQTQVFGYVVDAVGGTKHAALWKSS